MQTPDLAKVLSDPWPSVIGIIVGTLLTLVQRHPDVPYVRQLMGRTLARFSTPPDQVLDTELASAARRLHSGWRRVRAVLVYPFLFCLGMSSSAILREVYPALPHRGWYGAFLCGGLVGTGIWLFKRSERRFVLHHLQHLNPSH